MPPSQWTRNRFLRLPIRGNALVYSGPPVDFALQSIVLPAVWAARGGFVVRPEFAGRRECTPLHPNDVVPRVLLQVLVPFQATRSPAFHCSDAAAFISTAHAHNGSNASFG